ncbi:DUF551 domain-containing protein [Enterobacter kobei]|uniref:DUF551 domain-containing protein n=1 Tax=Enterobacter kobei TaxID=208224 RepID=UPI00292C83AC|nr:DUF551 domain-containing protein [Enterobacter kobei]MDV1942997.1 DUF551 domain-containing protein [Enterobacter kobei]
MSTIAREFTKEQLQQIIETDHVQCGEASALARIALASLEAEAVCVIDQSNLDYLKSGSDADVWPASRAEMGDVLLYRAAPPAPVSDEDLLHMAASAIDDLLSNKDRSGAGVWADIPAKLRRAAMLQGADGNSQVMNDYPETLPCPVSLEPGLKLGKGVATKILLEALQSRANYSAEIEVIKEVCRDIKDGDFLAAAKINSSSELVTTAYKLPKPIKDHRLNSGPDADYYYAGYQAGWNDSIGEAVICNSPVIPDGWVACSEQMPEQFKAILAFNEYGEVWSGAYDRYWNFYCDNLLVEHVTHWMPLPAAPQQEA